MKTQKEKGKKTSPNDLEIKVKAGGKEYKVSDEPSFLGTQELSLTRKNQYRPSICFYRRGYLSFTLRKLIITIGLKLGF